MKNSILYGGLAVVGIIGLGAIFATHSVTDKHDGLVSKGELTIGLEGTYAPYSYKDKHGELKGYDVDVSKAIAKQMGLKPVFVQAKFDSLTAGLDAHKYDVVMNNMAKTPDREKHYTFGKSYLTTQAVAITKDRSVKHLKDMYAKRAAQSLTSDYGTLAKDHGAELVAVPGFTEAMDLVSDNRADVSINSEYAWKQYHAKHPNTKLQAVVLKDVEPAKSYPILAKNSPIQKRFEQAQTKVKTSEIAEKDLN